MVEDHGRQGSLQVNVYLQMAPSSDSGITKTELALALQLIDDADCLMSTKKERIGG